MERRVNETAQGRDVADAVAAFLRVSDPLGCTPNEIVDALGLPIAATALQRDLERLVAHGKLARWGIGRGALYTLSASPAGRSTAPPAGRSPVARV
jgi:hypothetical protein